MGDIARLPKWAQKEIEDLKRTITMKDREIAEMERERLGDGQGPWFIDRGLREEKRLDTSVKYMNVEAGGHTFRIYPTHNDRLEIMCTDTWGDDMVVTPKSGNVVEIFNVKR